MAGKVNSFRMGAILVLGIAIGALALLLGGLHSGIFVFNPDIEVQNTDSLTPGTDRLNSFSCRKGERKEVYIGGIEDNYSTANLEPAQVSPLRVAQYRSRIGRQGAVEFTRQYDEAGVDNFLLDDFEISGKIANGIVVLKSRPLSSFENDSFAISVHSMAEDVVLKHNAGFSYRFAKFPEYKEISTKDDVLTVNILGADHQHLSLFSKTKESKPVSLLARLNASSGPRTIAFSVGDDRQVDFLGIALCFEPDQNLGMTYRINSHEASENSINLSCFDIDGNGTCNPYTGDTPCQNSLPLTCFKDDYAPILKELSPRYAQYWSGGHVKFTGAVRGDQFETQDDIHAFCRAEFGSEWRAATLTEGASNDTFFARGKASGVTQAWVDSKTEIYGNCWALRPDYTELQQ